MPSPPPPPSSVSSSALTKRPCPSTDLSLMPPPPIKKQKRPSTVLDEDTYTSALSHIIARDFFPGLLETELQQDYLNALESQDEAWISEASRKLQNNLATPQHRRRGTGFSTPRLPADTPLFSSATSTPRMAPRQASPPKDPESDEATKETKPDTTLSLTSFQSRYTSEDNESFNALLDRQNATRRDNYRFLWAPNSRIPGFRTIAHQTREQKLLTSGSTTKSLKKFDDRPAIPNTWTIKDPRNGLMFVPDNSPPREAKPAERGKEMPPKKVVYANTRMPPPAPQKEEVPERPDSPTSTYIRNILADAAAGHSPTTTTTGFDRAETPRVGGYSFVAETPTPAELAAARNPLLGGEKAGPFKIAETPRREETLRRMVDKVARGKRESGVVKDAGGQTPALKGRRVAGGATPARTPAGARLWANLGGRTPVAGGEGGGGVTGGIWDRKGTTPRVGMRKARAVATPKMGDKAERK